MMNNIERELFENVIALNFKKVEELLNNYKFDFNQMKSNKGHGFIMTYLNRYNEEDFITEDVDLKDVVKMLKLLFANGLTCNLDTTTCHSNPDHDIGSVFSTPILRSLECKNTDIAELLISHGADVTYQDREGNHALFYATHHDLATLYLRQFKDLDEQEKYAKHINKNNENALFYQIRNIRVLKLLVEYGLDSSLINIHGDNIVLHCVRYGLPECLEIILKNNPQLDTNFVNQKTHEDILFVLQHKKMLDVLYKYGLDIHRVNKDNQTVLFTTHNKISFVKTLLKYGINVNHQDNQGDTILHKHNTEDLIEILGPHFNFNIKNHQGDTVLNVYQKLNANDLYGGHQKTINFLIDEFNC